MRLFAAFLSVLLIMACEAVNTPPQIDKATEPTACGWRLSPEVAKRLGAAYELTQQKPPSAERAVREIDALLEQQDDLCPYEIATALEMRGVYKLQVLPPDSAGALADFNTALDQDAFNEQRAGQIRLVIARVHLTREEYQQAADGLQAHITATERAGMRAHHDHYRALAESDLAMERYNYARLAMEKAIRLTTEEGPAQKFDYSVLNYLYFTLGLRSERIALLQQATLLWPQDKDFTDQFTALLDPATASEVIAPKPQRNRAGETDAAVNPDQDAQPLVRIPPRFPDKCSSGPKKVIIVVDFDETVDGTVVNPRVISASDECLIPSSLRAVRKWRYRPKIVGGIAQPRYGVRTTFTFERL